jgi:SAM-dependent methyltransferase
VYRERNFARVARALRDEIIVHFRVRPEPIDDEAGLVTLDTNSTLVPDRARLLLDLYTRRTERDSIEGLEIADLGCGFGAMSLYFATAGATVSGVDTNRARLRVGAELAERFRLPAAFERGWLEEMALPDSHFDLAVMNNSLCYITDRDDRRRALANTLRILKPGGWLVLRDPSRLSPVDPFTGMPLIHQLPRPLAGAVLRLSARGRDRSRVWLMSPRSARRALRRAGFEQIRSERGVPGRRYLHLTARRPEASSERAAGD